MTVDEPRMRVTTNLAFGICLILLGSVLILDRLQLVTASQLLQFWPVALVLFGAALIIQSFQRSDAAQARPRDAFNGGHIFALIIFSIIMSQAWSRGVATRTEASETIDVVAVMGRHYRISTAPVFRGGEMTTIMGRTDLDLRKTTLAANEEVVVHVFTVMGESAIRVPEGWSVDLRATPVMGGARDRRAEVPDTPGMPRLVVRGFVLWGGLTIRQ